MASSNESDAERRKAATPSDNEVVPVDTWVLFNKSQIGAIYPSSYHFTTKDTENFKIAENLNISDENRLLYVIMNKAPSLLHN